MGAQSSGHGWHDASTDSRWRSKLQLLLLAPGGLLCLFLIIISFPPQPPTMAGGGEHGACPLCARYQVAREHVRVLCCVKGSPTPGPRQGRSWSIIYLLQNGRSPLFFLGLFWGAHLLRWTAGLQQRGRPETSVHYSPSCWSGTQFVAPTPKGTRSTCTAVLPLSETAVGLH